MSTILFVGQSSKHFSYYETSLRELCERGHTVVFRYDPVFSRHTIYPALDNFLKDCKNTKLEWITKSSFISRYISFFFRELRSYSWYLNRTDQSLYYTNRWADLFPGIAAIILKIRGVKKIIKQRGFIYLLNLVERVSPVPSGVLNDIKKVSPDLVYVSPGNMRYSTEIGYVKAASKLGITTVIAVLSWDNLTNKGLFHWLPDTFLAWNRHHKKELMALHGVKDEQIKIVGAQLFDKWANIDKAPQPVRGLLDFTKNPYILYLGSSSNIAKDETEVLEKIMFQIKEHYNTCHIIFKPHPAYYKYYQKLNIEGVMLLPEEFGLSETKQDISNFNHLVMSSKCVIGINTSGFLDSVIIGKRTFAYLSSEHDETQRLSAHYQLMTEYQVIDQVESYSDIMQNLKNNNEFDKQRQRFIDDFVRPNGLEKTAGYWAANIIEEQCRS
jgi:hypothetical protein